MARRNDRLRAELAAIDQEVDRAPAATRRLQRYLPIAAAVIAVGSFSAITWYAYNQGVLEGSEVAAPLIQPKGPLKLPPASPGGIEVPNRDKFVYSQLEDREVDDRKIERLLPPPEQPMERPKPEPPAGAAAEATPNGVPPALPPPGSAEQAAQAPTPEVAPAAESQGPVAQAGKAEGPIRLTPKSGKAPPSPPSPSVAPEPAKRAPRTAAAPKPPAAAAAGTRGAFIQLGALRSEADAERAWKGAQANNGDLLGKLRLDIEKAEIPGKGTFYRVQAGPLRDAAAAKSLCDALAKRKQGCFVVHRK